MVNHTIANNLNLPHGLELGKTLRTDIDPNYPLNTNSETYEAQQYEADFNELGFLDKVTMDEQNGHVIPEDWGLTWGTSMEDVVAKLSESYEVNISKRDMGKSYFASSMSDLSVQTASGVYKFYFINWKGETKTDMGLSMITVKPVQ